MSHSFMNCKIKHFFTIRIFFKEINFLLSYNKLYYSSLNQYKN